ncbi:MAG: serine/threonine protein kinase [Planctomycetes bacterium]|nr:serine/threonine protein kinase [Planctomycetota bacterium]
MANTTSAVSTSLGKYRLIRELSNRGSGTVHVAEESNSNRQIALKIMPLEGDRKSAFLADAPRLKRLEHDHLVPILDAGEIDGHCYLAMDLLRGETLQTRLKREHRLSMKESLRIAREAAAGIACLHDEGMIHCDLSPSNIWLEPSGRARLLGFGGVPSEENSTLLHRLEGPGSPGYLAPEQAAGEIVTPAADLFSLGCVLYQMTTGERPFKGDTDAALLRAAVFDHPKAARQINPEISQDLDELLTRLLAKLPADRPDSADDVMERLTEWLDPLAPKNRLPKLPEAVPYPASKRFLDRMETLRSPSPPPESPLVKRVEVVTVPESPAPPSAPRRNWLPDLVAGLLLLAGAVGLFFWWKASR